MKKLEILLPLACLFGVLLCSSAVAAHAQTELAISHNYPCDSSRNDKYTFTTAEDVYIYFRTTGTGSITVDVYVTYDDEWVKTGPTAPTLVDRGDGMDTITLTATSSPAVLGPFKIWSAPLTSGQFDIIVDENRNGVRDPSEVVWISSEDPGIYVIPKPPTPVPEFPFGTALVPLIAISTTTYLLKKRKLTSKIEGLLE